MNRTRLTLWLARGALIVVFFFNITCALTFVVRPAAYAYGFEVSGVPGEALVRGIGERIEPLSGLPALSLLLANPGIPLSTAAVYRAFDRRRGKEIALKVMLPSLLALPKAVRRFENEAELMIDLRHEGIVNVHDVGFDRATGIRDGRREFGEIIVVRCIHSVDARTATAVELPWETLHRICERMKSIEGVNRCLYDLTPKPPATIEYI